MACKECGGNGGHHKPGCGMSPAALQINNKDCTLFHSVTIPAIMGDETENPPANGLYKNVLLYYEASGNAYFYSSDGIPTKLTYATTDYNALTNKPTINGVTLEGALTPASLGININDATLTIKQGDTTLGAFSANASENVEINIGDTDDKIRVTMNYGSTDDWYGSGAGNAGLDFGWNEQDAVGYKIDAMAVEDPTFTDEKTGHVYAANDVLDLLDSGADIIFDNVPLGYFEEDTGENTISVTPVDGLSFTAKVLGEDGPVYTGTAAVMLGFSQGTFVPLCFAFVKGFTVEDSQSGEATNYPPRFTVQGVYHRRPSA